MFFSNCFIDRAATAGFHCSSSLRLTADPERDSNANDANLMALNPCQQEREESNLSVHAAILLMINPSNPFPCCFSRKSLVRTHTSADARSIVNLTLTTTSYFMLRDCYERRSRRM